MLSRALPEVNVIICPSTRTETAYHGPISRGRCASASLRHGPNRVALYNTGTLYLWEDDLEAYYLAACYLETAARMHPLW